jgi:hypothetical protein
VPACLAIFVTGAAMFAVAAHYRGAARAVRPAAVAVRPGEQPRRQPRVDEPETRILRPGALVAAARA